MRKQLQRLVAVMLLAVLAVVWVPRPGEAAQERTVLASAERYPVIFIPGMAGTELYNKNELVWINTWRLLGSQMPGLNLFQLSWLLPLRLAADGTTPYHPGYEIHVGDLMRHNLTDAYSGMLGMLKSQGYVEGKDLRLFPYDWRRDPVLAAEQLGGLVDRTLAETGARQVILIGHSMGGLIARDYVVRGGAPKVRASIALATPWLGSPLSYRAVQYGWDMGMKIPGTRWALLAPQEVKMLSRNFPSIYKMAPARGYFDWYPEGYLTRSGRNLSFSESLEQGLAPYNRAMAQQVPGHQERLLDGSDHGVTQFLLAGKGKQTLGGITERKDWLGFTHKTERYVDGDEVVPLFSADLGFSKDPQRAGRYIGKVAKVAYVSQPHTLFAQSPEVQGIVKDWLYLIHTEQAAGVQR